MGNKHGIEFGFYLHQCGMAVFRQREIFLQKVQTERLWIEFTVQSLDEAREKQNASIPGEPFRLTEALV